MHAPVKLFVSEMLKPTPVEQVPVSSDDTKALSGVLSLNSTSSVVLQRHKGLISVEGLFDGRFLPTFFWEAGLPNYIHD